MTISKYDLLKKINHYVYEDQLQVGNFILDEDKRTLFLGEEAFQLRDKLFSTLCFLIYSQGRLVHRDVIIESIWSNNCAVGQKSLTNAICMLRRIFSVDPNESVKIITISKTGYRLIEN